MPTSNEPPAAVTVKLVVRCPPNDPFGLRSGRPSLPTVMPRGIVVGAVDSEQPAMVRSATTAPAAAMRVESPAMLFLISSLAVLPRLQVGRDSVLEDRRRLKLVPVK